VEECERQPLLALKVKEHQPGAEPRSLCHAANGEGGTLTVRAQKIGPQATMP